MKPVLDEYVASTREPVGPSDLFGSEPSTPSRADPPSRPDETAPTASAEGWSLLAFLIGLLVLLAAAGAVLLAV